MIMAREDEVRSQDSYRPGEELFYDEEYGPKMKVKVLANKSDDEFIRYDLRVLEPIRSHPLCDNQEVGDVFSCEKIRGPTPPGLWDLIEVR